jgi:hypothetical protein
LRNTAPRVALLGGAAAALLMASMSNSSTSALVSATAKEPSCHSLPPRYLGNYHRTIRLKDIIDRGIADEDEGRWTLRLSACHYSVTHERRPVGSGSFTLVDSRAQIRIAVWTPRCRRIKLTVRLVTGSSARRLAFSTSGPAGRLCRAQSALLLKPWTRTMVG